MRCYGLDYSGSGLRKLAGCFENGNEFSYSLEFVKSLGWMWECWLGWMWECWLRSLHSDGCKCISARTGNRCRSVVFV